MYARVTVARFQNDKHEQGIRIMRQVIVPAIQQRAGFKGVTVLSDPQSAQGMMITLWETEANLRASHGHIPGAEDELPRLLAEKLSTTTYEVVEMSWPAV